MQTLLSSISAHSGKHSLADGSNRKYIKKKSITSITSLTNFTVKNKVQMEICTTV